MANGILGSLLILLKVRSDVKGITRANRELRNTDRIAKTVRSSLRLLSGLGLAFGGRQMISNYLEFEKNLGAVHSRFMAITKDSVRAEEQFNHARDTARSLGLDMFETANNYSLFFAGTAKQLGADGAQQVFDSWSKVSRVLHLTPYQMERITYALREMSSKGTIYSSDLRMQIGTHVPDAVGIATQAIENLGIKGVKSIEDFQKASKNNVPLINKFIKEFSRLSEAEFASPEAIVEAMKQPDALLGIIKDFGQDFMIEFSNAGGNQLVYDVLTGIIDVLKGTDFKGLITNLGLVAQVVGKLLTFLIHNIPLILKAIAGLIIALTVGHIANLGANRVATMAGIFLGGKMSIGRIGAKEFIKLFLLGLRPLARSLLKPLIGLVTRVLGIFGGLYGIIASAVIMALIDWIPRLLKSANQWLNDRARTITDPEQITKTQKSLQDWVNKFKKYFSPEEMNKLFRQKNIYVIVDGIKRYPTANQNYAVTFNINNNGQDLSKDDFADRVVDKMIEATKEAEKEKAKRQLGGVTLPRSKWRIWEN